MAKVKVSEWSATPGSNTDIDGINIAENCPPSGINDAIREMMSQIKDFQTGAAGDSFNGPVGSTTPAAGAFTTLSASGAVTLSGGTANGVPYLNASKVLTSGSALTFDGTTLSNTVADNSINYKAKAASGVLRFSGYTPAYSGSLLEATNAAESAYTQLTSAASTFVWSINGSGQAATLTSTGLGLGVTPSAWATFKAMQIGNGTADTFIAVSGNQGDFGVNAYYNAGWKYQTTGVAASRYEQSSGVHQWFTAPSGTAGNAITFTQAMTLDASGNLLLGTTSGYTGRRLDVRGSNGDYLATLTNSSTGSPFGFQLLYTGISPNNTSSDFITASDTSTQRFSVRSNGGIANYSANNINLSDVRTKTDIQDAPSYLTKICAIPVRTFKYKDQTDDALNLGAIAQEVEAIAPELVDVSGFGETPEDGIPLKAIYQTDMQYALMKCIQELKAEFDAYKAAHP